MSADAVSSGGVTPRRLKMLMKSLAPAGYNLIVLGPPGVGKSDSAFQFARDTAKEAGLPLLEQTDFYTLEEFRRKCPNGNCVLLLYINTNTALPVDLAGLPDKIKTPDGRVEATWYPMYYWIACREAKYCIVVLDEFNATQNPDTLAMVMRMLSECRAGTVDLGCGKKDGGFTLVVALGNPPEMSSIANGIPAPLLGGKALYVNAEPPTLHEWIQYMHSKYGNRWDRRIAGLLALKPDIFSVVPPSAEVEEPYPTPRGWTKSAVMCYNDPANCESYIQGFCGTAGLLAFREYLKLGTLSIDDVLKVENDLERELKAIVWASQGGLCQHLKDAGVDEKMTQLIKKLSPSALASITFLSSPSCPRDLQKLYKYLPAEVRRLVFGKRYDLSEKMLTAETTDDIEEELI